MNIMPQVQAVPKNTLAVQDGAKSISGEEKGAFKDLLKTITESMNEPSLPEVTEEEPEVSKEAASEMTALFAGLFAGAPVVQPTQDFVEPSVENIADVSVQPVLTEQAAIQQEPSAETAMLDLPQETAAVPQQKPVLEQKTDLPLEGAEQLPEEEMVKPVYVNEAPTVTQTEQPKVSVGGELPVSRVSKTQPQQEDGEANLNPGIFSEQAARVVQPLEPEQKLPEANTTFAIYQNEFPEQISEQILYKSSDGVKQFEIQLVPEELGKIDIVMTFEQGRASVTMICEQTKAYEVLSGHLDNIRSILENATGNQAIVTTQAQEQQEPYRDFSENARQQSGRQQQNREQQDRNETILFVDRLRFEILQT